MNTSDYKNEVLRQLKTIDEIASLIKLVLENNHFKFGDSFYLQKMGTAMGSSMAPSYASLFTGKLENDFLNARVLKPTLWLRFLDDIFMIWDHSLNELHSFIDTINNLHPCIKFTHTISQKSVTFLDVKVSKEESLDICTDVFEKETNIHQYLDYTSCHPKKCKDSIPYSQAKRYRRITSDDNKFHSSLDKLRSYFQARYYPNTMIDSAFEKVSQMSQSEALKSSIKHQTKLSKDENLRHMHKTYRPIMAFKRPQSLNDYLVSSGLKENNEDTRSPVISCCNGRRCSHCVSIITGSQFSNHITGETFNIRQDANCKTNNVIYLLTCKKCKLQYVGQTSQPVSKRMNSNRFDISNYTDPSFSSLVATHFNSDNQCINDFSFMPIDVIDNTFDRLCKETYWKHRLGTVHPGGMNSEVLFKTEQVNPFPYIRFNGFPIGKNLV